MRVNLGQNSYDILIGTGLLGKAGEILDLNRRVLIVTDDGVPEVYAETVAKQCASSIVHVIRQGEESKSLAVFESLQKEMLEHDFHREDCVLALGGGVVGDLAGFAASAYMRGIDFYNVPTTVLSQVDSSIGGKTAVNFMGVKNILGAFYQPKKVVIDFDVLRSLPKRQFGNGIVEAFKMAATFDEALFQKFLAAEGEEVFPLITSAIDIKRKVVEEDEKEAGLRKVLNFGHTLGHGIEVASSGKLLHGESVALGMLPMCDPAVAAQILAMMKKYDLPVVDFDRDLAMQAIMHDKKGKKDSVTVVYVPYLGTYEFRELSYPELKTLLERIPAIVSGQY